MGHHKHKQRAVLENVLVTLEELFPRFDFDNRPVCELYAPHVASAVDRSYSEHVFSNSCAVLAERLAFLRKELGLFHDARPYAQVNAHLQKSVYGSLSVQAATSLDLLGSISGSLGDLKKAQYYFKRSLSILEQIVSPEDVERLSVMNNLGVNYFRRGLYRKATGFLTEVINRELDSGRSNREHIVAINLNNLANAHRELGENETALGYLKAAIEHTVSGGKSGYPNHARQLNNLAITLLRLGRFEEALETSRQSLKIYGRHLGKENNDYAKNLSTIGNIYFHLGDLKKARLYQRQAISIGTRALGSIHVDNAVRIGRLAMVVSAIGNVTEAERLFSQAHEILSAKLKKGHKEISILNTAIKTHEKKKQNVSRRPKV